MHATICDILLDCFQNSVEAGAKQITLTWSEMDNWLTLTIKDDGKGMSQEVLKKVFDPWFTDGQKHKHRRVGLGLPFLKQTIDQTGGKLSINSKEGVGTTLQFCVDLSNIDLPPQGELAGTLLSMLLFDGTYEVCFKREYQQRGKELVEYSWSKGELQEILGNFNSLATLNLLKDYIQSQEDYINEYKKE